MAKLKLGVIVGSNRKESINRQLAQALIKLGDGAFEAKLIQIDDLPMYNQDHEQPVPGPVARFKSEVEGSDALLFVTAEHNRSLPAVLKNAIDWGARPYGKTSWPDKPAAITGTSPGAISSAIAQQHLRAVLGDQGLHLMGGETYILFKPELFDADHNVPDDSVRGFLKAFIDKFATFAGKLTGKQTQQAAA
ncbi:MAG: NAD(P)H-dependent oxidoreductase [Pseudolabrys sp.]|nr:NAD(P)H-dependent oxidoreductase [Pseudolabrys sp.]